MSLDMFKFLKTDRSPSLVLCDRLKKYTLCMYYPEMIFIIRKNDKLHLENEIEKKKFVETRWKVIAR